MNFLTQVVESHYPSIACVICEWNFSTFIVILSKDFLPQSTDASDTQIFIFMKKILPVKAEQKKEVCIYYPLQVCFGTEWLQDTIP